MSIKKVLKTCIVIGLLLTPFLAFLITPSMLFPFITGKNFAFRIIAEIIFAFWVLLALKDESYRLKFSWILGIFAIFIAVIGIADIFGVNASKSFWSNFERMEGFLGMIHLFLYFIVISCVIKTDKLWNWFLGTWVVSSVIMCIYGLLQLSGKIGINQGGVRVDGTFGNATYLAVYLLFSIFLSAILFFRLPRKKNTVWIFLPVVALQFLLLYHTATRGAMIGLFGGVLVALLLGIFTQKNNPMAKKISIGAFIVVALFLTAFFLAKNTSFVKNSPVLARFASISPQELKTQGRYYIWPMAVKGAIEKPFFGWGQEGFNYIFNKYYNPEMYAQEQWFDRAHSAPLDWLVASGLFGFIAYLLIYVLTVIYLWKRVDRLSMLEKCLMTGLLSAYFFQSIFVFDNLFSYVLFFTVLAFIHGHVSKDIKWPEVFSKDSFKNSISAIAVILIVFSMYFFNVKPIMASRSLIFALNTLQVGAPNEKTIEYFEKALNTSPLGRVEAREQLVNSVGKFLAAGVPEDVRKKYADMTVSELQKQIAQTPDDVRYYVFLGTFLRSAGDYANSEAVLKKALELSPKKQTIWYELGAAQISAKDLNGALNSFKTAYDLEQSSNDAKLLYALSALYVKNETLANELFSTLPRDTLLYDDRIVGTLADLGRYSDLIEILSKRIAEGRDEYQNNVSLAISYLRNGQRQKSIEVLSSYITRHPDRKTELEPYIKEIQAGKDF